jgi:hypothetical protein
VRLVLATNALDDLGGSESYLVTVADQLQRLGHDVHLYAAEIGQAAEQAAALGLRVVGSLDALPGAVDAMIVQDGAVAADLAGSHPLVPHVFVAHSDIFDLQLPLNLPGLTAAVVTLYDRVDRRIRALAGGFEVVRLTQPIDVTRFAPIRPLRDRPRVALALGNYVRGARADVLEEACELAGIELRRRGGPAKAGPSPTPELDYNEADIVFGKARVIVEAMACGRAAYVYDHNGAEGWVTPERYAALARDNFGGQSDPIVPDAARVAADLAEYRPALGVAGRDLAVAHHAASAHAAALVELLQRVQPRPAPVEGPWVELARLVRMAHRADKRQFVLHAETERLAAGSHEQEADLARARTQLEVDRTQIEDERAARVAAQEDAAAAHEAARVAREQAGAAGAEAAVARAEVAVARAEAAAARAEADAAHRALADFAGTARWRAIQGLLRPVDRLRAGRRRVPSPARPAPASAPVPFIVGIPRSGTTLLRLQLDAHPDLAIGPETGIGFLVEELARDGAGPAETAAAIAALDTFPDLALDRAALDALLAAVTPWTLADGLRAVLGADAARRGKPRWGEKTPMHLHVADRIAALLPEAHVVHVIRDGRAVLCSVRDLHFAPGDGSVEAIACDWRDGITALRAAAASGAVPNYTEVIYEALVEHPEQVLRTVCERLELAFDPAMLRAHEQARERFDALPEVRRDGSATRTREERWAIHRHTATPPDPARAERWRSVLPAEDIARFEAVAGPLLSELGYPLTTAAGRAS